MNLKTLLVMIILILPFVPIATSYDPAHAKVYVDDGYGIGTPGWGTTAFNNIQTALNNVDIGGTVTVYAGTYTNFTVNKRVTIAGENRNTVFVEGTGTLINFTHDDINFSGFTIRNGGVGISIHSDWNIIYLCKFIGNEYGMRFYNRTEIPGERGSSNNTIFYNDFIDDIYGMELFNYDNYDNLMYLNNFLNCTAIDDAPSGEPLNHWNSSYGTYPDAIVGGNYWSDNLFSTDLKHGTYPQSILGADGIVDNLYTCGRSGDDYYPHTTWINPPMDVPPTLSNEDPENNATLISPSLSEVSVTITCSRSFDWSIEGKYVTRASGTSDTTGVKAASISGLPALTQIRWYVNVTDGSTIVNQSYVFSTSTGGATTLQEMVDDAGDGDHLVIPAGTYYENIVVNKTITFEGANPTTTFLDGSGIGAVIEIKHDGVVLQGFTIQNSGSPGVYVHDCTGVEIRNNIIHDNGDGIYFVNVTNSLIDGNHIYRNDIGIHVLTSQGITLNNNNASGNGPPRINGNIVGAYLDRCSDSSVLTNHFWYNNNTGLALSGCDYCNIIENNMFRNGNKGIEATTGNVYNTYSRNTVHENEQDGIWLEYETGAIVSQNHVYDNQFTGIRVFMYSDNCSIGGNVVYSNWEEGIDLWGASDCKVFLNNCSGNEMGGIRLYCRTQRNLVYENELIGFNYEFGFPGYQPYGVYIQASGVPGDEATGNMIYHNNFILNDNYEIRDGLPNGMNRWNDTYPSGGNYYEEFHNDSQHAVDFYHGYFQNQPGVDGIVDVRYDGEPNATDYYPLRNPYRVAELASADFTWNPGYPRPNEQTTFTALTDTNIKTWNWNFGDGYTGTGETKTHQYASPGWYVVSLRVISERGLEDTMIKRIYITPPGVFIPDPQPPKYPGYTVSEMYDLMHATNLTSSKSKVKVMIIDSGVLQQSYKDFDLSWVTSEHSPSWADGTDQNGHGTWCNYAIAFLVKTKLPNVKQISYRIFGPSATTSNDILLAALDDALKEGVDVVSLSVGGIGNPNDAFSQKVNELYRNGIIVVCAAGNFGPYSSTILSPGCSLGAFTVAAEDPQWYGDTMTIERRNGVLNLRDDNLCEFSSRGPVPKIYPKPDITAPGESILGPWVSNGKIVEKALSGTSMATPLVAGGVTVIVAQNKDLIEQVKMWHFWDKGVVVTALEDSLRESAYTKGGVNEWGAGIVQFDKASKLYAGKLQGIVIMSSLIVFFPFILLLLLLVAYYIYRKRHEKARKWWVHK